MKQRYVYVYMRNTPADVHRERGTNAMLPSSALHCNWKRGIISIALAEEVARVPATGRGLPPMGVTFYLILIRTLHPRPLLCPPRETPFSRELTSSAR